VRADEAITSTGPGFGANAWAVSPQRTLSGRPLLANDPHLGVQLPASFFAIHLSGPHLDVSGASIPGMPGVVIGHTSGVAWGLALSMLDDQDLYRLTVDDLGSRELVDGAWQPLRTVTENIAVRWQDDPVLLKVRLSVHGPVVREQRDEALAVAWAGLHGPTMLDAVLGMNRATTVSEVASAWADVISPSLCVVAADTSGDILHQVVGQAPVRVRGAGRLPAAGSDSGWAWKGFRPVAEGHRRVNPIEGFVVAANQDLFGEGLFPSDTSFPGEFEPPWRARRISAVLSGSEGWTVSSTQALQRDAVSNRAIALLKLLRADLQEQPGAAVDELLAWDGDMRATSHGAKLFAELLVSMEEEIGHDEVQRFSLTDNPIGPEEILRLLAGGLDPRWWDDARGSMKRSPIEVIEAAVRNLEDSRGRIRWGDVHQVAFDHPLASLPGIGRLLSDTWSRGPFPSDGSGATVNAQDWERARPFRVATIPALRFVADVGNWDATVLGLSLGQSGRPWSRHYDDQIADWLHGHSAVMPFSRKAVREAAAASLRLEPREQRPRAALDRQ
jgi:penicillin amidase